MDKVITGQAIAIQAIAGQTIVSWAAVLKRKEIALEREKNTNSIGEKPLNLMETEKKNQLFNFPKSIFCYCH